MTTEKKVAAPGVVGRKPRTIQCPISKPEIPCIARDGYPRLAKDDHCADCPMYEGADE